jgi:cell division inhibitor SepF
MANAFKKMAGYLGLVDDEELDFPAAEPVAVEPVRGVRPVRARSEEASTERPSYLRSTATPSAVSRPAVSAIGDQSILNRIVAIHPRFYNEARNIGEHYRGGQPVIMNLSDMEESERKRLVDFASGLVFGHHGSIERITPKVFLLTPPNVSVSNEDKSAAAEASFFNQS